MCLFLSLSRCSLLLVDCVRLANLDRQKRASEWPQAVNEPFSIAHDPAKCSLGRVATWQASLWLCLGQTGWKTESEPLTVCWAVCAASGDKGEPESEPKKRAKKRAKKHDRQRLSGVA